MQAEEHSPALTHGLVQGRLAPLVLVGRNKPLSKVFWLKTLSAVFSNAECESKNVLLWCNSAGIKKLQLRKSMLISLSENGNYTKTNCFTYRWKKSYC